MITTNYLLPVVVMVVACFLLCEELDKIHNTFWLTAQDYPDFVLTDALQFHTMELIEEKINQLSKIKSPLRQWLEFFYFADKKSEEDMKVLLQSGDPAVEQAYDAFLKFNQNDEMRQIVEVRQQYEFDYNTSIKHAKKERDVKAILRILTKRFKSVPEQIKEQIQGIPDLEQLEQLADLALDCKSIEEFGKCFTKVDG